MSRLRLLKLTNFRRFSSLNGYEGSSKRLQVLGIETSCDDTGVAIVDSDRNILGEAKYSQAKIHAMHGGIIPPVAKDLHGTNIRKAVNEVVEKSNVNIKDLDGIAVTIKPGMISNLEVGIEYAKDLCTLYNKPLIPIHHMEAHALTVRVLKDVEFPFLVLLASGGHCILALAESVTKFIVLGESHSVSPGKVLDKMARILNLRNIEELVLLQGGEAMEIAAKKGNPLGIDINFAVNQKRDCNFYLTGFESIVKRFIEEEEKRLKIVANQVLPNVSDICATLQFKLFKYICQRVEIGMNYLYMKEMINPEKRTLVVSGGVASNEFFRKMLEHVCTRYEYELMVPPKNLCTDNGVMIAWNGIEKLRKNLPIVKPDEFQYLRPSSRCSLGKNISNDVTLYAWKGSYIKFDKLIEEEMKRQSMEALPEPKVELIS